MDMKTRAPLLEGGVMDNSGYPRTSHLPPLGRNLTPLPLSIEPLIKGRIGSSWLGRNLNYIRKREFYDRSLTEEDLKQLISQRKENMK